MAVGSDEGGGFPKLHGLVDARQVTLSVNAENDVGCGVRDIERVESAVAIHKPVGNLVGTKLPIARSNWWRQDSRARTSLLYKLSWSLLTSLTSLRSSSEPVVG